MPKQLSCFQLAMSYREELSDLIHYYAIPAIHYVRNSLKEILTSIDSALLMTFLRLIDFRLVPLTGKDNKPPPGPQYQALIRKYKS